MKPSTRDLPADPADLTLERAVERYLNRRTTDLSAASLDEYRNRLGRFVGWAHDEGLRAVGDLTWWVPESFEDARRGAGIAPKTLENEMDTLKGFFEYLETIRAVDADLSESVHVPSISKADRVDDTTIAASRALRVLDWWATQPVGEDGRASRYHVTLALLWHVGCRVGAVRALDVGDFDPDRERLRLLHRPATDTPLKNDHEGERVVGLSADVVELLQDYVDEQRHDLEDDYGREPLVTSSEGRPHTGTLGTWTRRATLPCHYGPCPHGRDPAACPATQRLSDGPECPSARSPHPVRSGAITWMRDLELDPHKIAKRVNTSVSVIEDHYDAATELQRMERRRRPHVERLRIEDPVALPEWREPDDLWGADWRSDLAGELSLVGEDEEGKSP